MNITPNFDRTEAFDGSFDRLPAGGYVCKIMNAWCENSRNGSEMLCLALDIAEGAYAGKFSKEYKNKKTTDPNARWGCTFKQFTLDNNGSTNSFFKGLLKSVQDSNPGYMWNWQEASLNGKLIGIIFREEEFVANDGSIKTTVRPAFTRSVQRIRDGVEVPEIRRLSGNAAAMQSAGFTPVSNEKLPWEK